MRCCKREIADLGADKNLIPGQDFEASPKQPFCITASVKWRDIKKVYPAIERPFDSGHSFRLVG